MFALTQNQCMSLGREFTVLLVRIVTQASVLYVMYLDV